MNVSEVRVGILDAAGTPIEVVYVKNAPSYAIYGTQQRVMVHLADDTAERGKQQEMLATLNPLRNEINAMIDGWRSSPEHGKEALTRLYDRRVADALALAFEGNSIAAQALLKSTLDEISEERQSRGRIQHLLFAGGTAIGIGVFALFAFLVSGTKTADFLDNDINGLLFAAAVGAVGALASIAIAIQERRLATDLQPRDNITDAVLRIAVGSVGALLLIAMIRSDLINLDMQIAEAPAPATEQASARQAPGPERTEPRPEANATPTAGAPAAAPVSTGATPPAAGAAPPAAGAGATTNPGTGTGGTPSLPATSPDARSPGGDSSRDLPGQRIGKSRTTELMVMIVIAFFAGFTERLVSRLAERTHFREVAADLPAGSAPRNGRRSEGRNGPGGGHSGQGGGGTGGPGPAGGAGATFDAEETQDEHVDGCLADIELADDDLTDDSELPETTGGVADEPRN